MSGQTRRRLDDAVVELTGLTRSQARSMIIAGRVRVDGETKLKAGHPVRADADVLVDRPAPFVSRGGEKLEGALRAFALDVTGAEALDVGASTGGFTDALLAAGARSVVALDVGYGQLAWKIRSDPRVKTIERSNFRLVADDAFPGGFDTIVIDASFISLRTIVARALGFLRPAGTIVALVKPQFEAGRDRLGAGGVVRERSVHDAILREVRDGLVAAGARVMDACVSPLRGPSGNIEFFYRLEHGPGPSIGDARLDALVAQAYGTPAVDPEDGSS